MDDEAKLKKIKKICGKIQKRNKMSDKSKKKCEIGIAKRWGVKKAKI